MFEIHNKRKQFWQWDTGQRLIVNADVCSEVHFCNGTSDCSMVCEVYEEDGLRLVNVPNVLLQVPKAIKVYAFICDADDHHTQREMIFPVFPRSKPEDYVYTETEVLNYASLSARISKLEENGVGGGNAKVTAESIKAALGYTPADAEGTAKTPVVVNAIYNGDSIAIPGMTIDQLEEMMADGEVIIVASNNDETGIVIAKCIQYVGAVGTLYLMQDGENVQSVGCIIALRDNGDVGVVGRLTVTPAYIPDETISEIAKQAAAGVVKSVNGVTPDKSGNVEVETGNPTDEQIQTAVDAYLTENPVSGGGMSATAINLLIEVLESAVYGTNVSGKIASLKEALLAGGSGGGDTGGGDMPDNPVEPDEPVVPDDITVSGGVMTIISVGSEIAVSGGVMTIA